MSAATFEAAVASALAQESEQRQRRTTRAAIWIAASVAVLWFTAAQIGLNPLDRDRQPRAADVRVEHGEQARVAGTHHDGGDGGHEDQLEPGPQGPAVVQQAMRLWSAIDSAPRPFKERKERVPGSSHSCGATAQNTMPTESN